ncbi:ArsR/SmtB family transcription factor [Streptomyces zagrosensis]|uniref:DNA-binding transcriptional ArsR family regulator n=1 Tax=Streptomyces zagrosensis TaxID=1042984 RepID=A0A7W9QFG3_9ACTN|nr:winged helix-turn-helix domain-containing protein [Streptomyces zagrosensis]MBB5939290.1 DNA-binding transcriptional ArsR family regulator [Streptomyces zagrosensis]
MLRLHCTAEDLLHVTFAAQPAPLMEMVMALAALQRTDLPSSIGRWQRQATETLPPSARPLLELVTSTGRGPLFLDFLTSGVDEGIDLVRAASASFVRSELQRVCAPSPPSLWIRSLADQDQQAWSVLLQAISAAHGSLLGPHWKRLIYGFDAERAWRVRLMAEQGIQSAITSLAPGARWLGTTVEFDAPYDRDVVFDGEGLVLLPSMFWRGWPLLAARPDTAKVLVYPAMVPFPLLGNQPATDSLAVLLGRTRAAALEVLARQCTTSDLARELGISKSSASEHAKALRDARLISTTRDGKAVWHSCTPLGVDLLTATTHR